MPESQRAPSPTDTRSKTEPVLGHGHRIGNYIIERELGVGAEASVYLARDLVLRRPVALKVLHAEGKGEIDARGLDEARLIAAFDHPHIVRIYHVELSGGTWYVAMEFVEGGSLDQGLKKSGPLQTKKALLYGLQAADALEYAHQKGVIHCDVKLKNLLVTASGAIKLADFGLARVMERQADAGPVGTPSFMAPEVWAGEKASVRSDVYALGCCLYALVAGKPPFSAPDLDSLERAHATVTPKAPVGVAPPVVDLILNALAKNPDDRPATARAFFDDMVHTLRRLGFDRRRLKRQGRTVHTTLGGLVHRHKAETRVISLPPFVVIRRALLAALFSSPRVVFVRGEWPHLLDQLTRKVIDELRKRARSVGHVVVGQSDERVRVVLADRLGLSRNAPANDIVRALAADPHADVAKMPAILACWFKRAPRDDDLADLVALGEAAITDVVRFVSVVSDTVDERRIRFRTKDVPSFVIESGTYGPGELAEFARTWTQAATHDRITWTRDAELVAAHFGAQKRAQFDALVQNATVIAMRSKFRTVTTWCVLGANEHAGRLESPDDVAPPWTSAPEIWPDHPMMELLKKLRGIRSARLEPEAAVD